MAAFHHSTRRRGRPWSALWIFHNSSRGGGEREDRAYRESSGIFEGRGTQPDPGPPTRQPRWGGAGMHRRSNAAGLSPRAVIVTGASSDRRRMDEQRPLMFRPRIVSILVCAAILSYLPA